MLVHKMLLAGGLLVLCPGLVLGQGSRQQSGRKVTGAAERDVVLSSVDLVPSVTSMDFQAVAGGFTAQQVLTLTNNGNRAARILAIDILLGGAGNAQAWTLDIDGTTYAGGASNVSYPVEILVGGNKSLPVTVTFQPTVEQYDSIDLRFTGFFDVEGGFFQSIDTIDVDVSGLGGHEGDPFMHPVIDAESVVIDYDGDSSESVAFDGSTSHTHEPGRVILGYEWSESGVPFDTNPLTTHVLPLGMSSVTLEITDDGTPARVTSESVDVTVRAASDVPGVLAFYYDATGGSAVALLDAVPAAPDFGEVVATTTVNSIGGMVGRSSLPGPSMVQLIANIDLATAGNYDFAALGGIDRRLEVNGVPVTGTLALAAGRHALEGRFAVEDAGAEMPVSITVSLAGGPELVPQASDLSHDETNLVPIINEMPTLGIDAGGNTIFIDGLGFHPRSGVRVNWGATQFDENDFSILTPTRIEFLSPPGSGSISVTVETPQGTSMVRTFGYSPSGPVPVQWDIVLTAVVPQPTAAVWGPDRKLYVASLDGRMTRMEFSTDYTSVVSTTTFTGVSALTNPDTLGITINPYDPPSPVRLYVAHAKHFVNGGSSFTGPSPYTGGISMLEGPNFDTPVPIVTQLPSSNHDHAIMGIQFDHNGDLFISSGSMTNSGVKHPNAGDLPESPLSAAILKAELSKPGFNGAISYVETLSGVPNNDQVYGDIVDVAPGSDVFVHAPGLRNAYGLIYATTKFLYCTDNGPNVGFGAQSTGPTTEAADPFDSDEFNLIEFQQYYGHPNRNRGRVDARQNVYYPSLAGLSSSIPNVYAKNLSWLPSSCNGVDEYRSNNFQGQIRGRFFVQKWASSLRHTGVSPNGRRDYGQTVIDPTVGALSVITLPNGALATINLQMSEVVVRVPNDLAAVGLVVHDVFPWRAPATGGYPFTLCGVGFGDLTDTSVTIDGLPVTLTSVMPTRIEGLIPAHASPNTDLADIGVTVDGNTTMLTDAFRFLFGPGLEPGAWSRQGIPVLRAALGEVAAVEIDGILYLVGEGDAGTYGYDIHALSWDTSLASRPYVGHHHSAEALDGKLYLIGGLDGGSEGKLQIYDPVLDTWTLGADLSWAGGSISTCVINGQLYAAGGIVTGFTVNNTAVYDPVLDTWTSLPIMPEGRNHTAAGTDGERFWIFGGRRGGNFVSNGNAEVMVFDPQANSWEASDDGVSVILPLPIGRGGMGKAIWYQDEFYIFGGETLDGPGATSKNVYDRVDVYDPAGNSWRLDAPMMTPRHGLYPVLFESRMFLPGGGTKNGNSQSTKFDTFNRQ